MKKINTCIFFVLFIALMPLHIFSQTAIANFGTNPGNINGYQYIPSNMPADAALVVVLHGCTQTATSYAAETAWNTLAATHKFYLVYGEQKSANNSNSCFNYWEVGDVSRGQGEALSVKQLVDYMKTNYSIDNSRVFVTGLSAGGAMTIVMASAYPEVFNAAAEMAGLPYKVTDNSTGVYLAAVGLVDKTPQEWGDLVRAENPGYAGSWPRMAIFHGTSDVVINKANGGETMEQFTNLHGCDQVADYTATAFNGNSSVKFEQHFNAAQQPVVVKYEINGMAHGTAVDPGSCFQQGGTVTSLSFDVDFYAPFWAAQFFGILQLPYSITGPATVSINQQGVVYSVPQTAGSTYEWRVPASASIVSGQGTNSITVNWGNKNGTVTVTETPTGGCKKGPVEIFVTAGAATPTLDAALTTLTVPATQVCTASFATSFTLTNPGQTTISNLTIYYKLDNGTLQTYPWSGSLAASQSAIVSLPAISPAAGSHTLRIFSSLPNGNNDGNNTNDTLTKNFTAGVTPVVSLGNNISQCGGSVSLNAQNAGAAFVWSTGATSQTISATQSGSYTVTVTSNGCSATGNVSVTINTTPVVALGAGGSFCGTQHTLDAGNPGSLYIWSNSATSQTINVTSSGTYTVTVSAGANCSATGSVNITLNTPPAVSLQLAADTVCSSAGVVTLNGGNPAGGTFTGNYINAGVFDATGAGTGTYPVTYTYTDNNQCAASAIQNIEVVLCTSIGNIFNEEGFNIYPNPATNQVQLSFTTIWPGMQLKIMDASGKIVAVKNITQANTLLDVSDFSKGIYTISVNAGSTFIKKKLVIQ